MLVPVIFDSFDIEPERIQRLAGVPSVDSSCERQINCFEQGRLPGFVVADDDVQTVVWFESEFPE